MSLDIAPRPRIGRASLALWSAAAAISLAHPSVDNANRLLVASAVTVTLRAALDRRDSRLAEYTRLAYWAGTVSRDEHPDAH